MSKDEQTERVEKVAWAIADVIANRRCDGKAAINDQRRAEARAAIAAMKEAGMDRLVAEGQQCDAVTPQEAAKVSAEDRENIVDEIESIICETHEMDVRDIDYAENIVSWLERHHPDALRAILEKTQ